MPKGNLVWATGHEHMHVEQPEHNAVSAWVNVLSHVATADHAFWTFFSSLIDCKLTGVNSDALDKCFSASILCSYLSQMSFTYTWERSVKTIWELHVHVDLGYSLFCFNVKRRSSLQKSSHNALWRQSFVMRYVSPMEMFLLAVVKLLPGNTFKGIVYERVNMTHSDVFIYYLEARWYVDRGI